MTSPAVTPRRIMRRVALGFAAATTALAIGLSPTAASAVGSFNVKLSAFGCTEGDYKGSSYTYTVSGAYFAYATTSYQYPICAGVNSIPGARPIAGGTLGAWAYGGGSHVTTRIQKAFFDQTVNGHHSVGNGAHLRNT